MALARNILIFHQGALGDFIVTWPLALTLARLHPQSRVFYVTAAGKGALAEKVLRVESLDIESGWHHLYSASPQLPAPLAKRLTNSHTVVSFVADDRDRWVSNVKAVAPDADVLTLSSKPPADYAGHVSEFILDQLSSRPAAHTAASQILKSISTRGVAAAPTRGDTIVIHPGAGSPAKCWPPERFVGLARALRDQGHPVAVLLGEVERERWPAAQVAALGEVATVESPQSLLDLLSHVQPARCFVGNDSGPGHLAGILGVPTIAIFGANDSTRWKPLGPVVEVVPGASLEGISVDQVLEAVGLLEKRIADRG
jgi:heptosyltransferase-3